MGKLNVRWNQNTKWQANATIKSLHFLIGLILVRGITESCGQVSSFIHWQVMPRVMPRIGRATAVSPTFRLPR